MPDLNYPALWFWFSMLQFGVTGLLALYVRKVAKDRAVEERFGSIEGEVTRIEGEVTRIDARGAGEVDRVDKIVAGAAEHLKRTAVVEQQAHEIKVRLEHLPTQRQFDLLTGSITALHGELKNTQGRLEGINRAVDLINEFLINQGGEKKRA